MSSRKGFNFYESYFDVYKELSKVDKLEFIDALLNRQFYGIEPEGLKGLANFAYISQKHSIDRQIKGFEDKTGTTLDPCQGGSSTPSVQEEEKEEGKEKEEWFIDWFNSSIKDLKGSGKFKLNDKVKRQLHSRIKEGYKSVDFKHALNAISKDQYHKDNGYKYLTPEFITRLDKLEMWSNATITKLEEEKGKGDGGFSMMEYYEKHKPE